MEPPFPSPTRTWHNDTYAAIDPRHPSNSRAGKTVIVTGAGSGVGRETAIAYAVAGAEHIILVGRTKSTLLETQKLLLNGPSRISVCVASVSDLEQMKSVAEAAGTWDIFILNAGHIAKPSKIHEADMSDWWASYETNIKAILIAAQLFIPNANPSGAYMLGVTAGGVVLAPEHVAGLSAYMTSKTAQIKIMEWLGSENPNLFTASVHPGVIDTKMLRDSGLSGLPYDKAVLPAHFMVWLTQPKTKFLKSKFIWVNWDVDQLCEQEKQIAESSTMTINSLGWPYSHGDDPRTN